MIKSFKKDKPKNQQSEESENQSLEQPSTELKEQESNLRINASVLKSRENNTKKKYRFYCGCCIYYCPFDGGLSGYCHYWNKGVFPLDSCVREDD